ncbi:C-5 cytosine methyltransferase DmtA [Apiospora arundinis]
MAQQPLPQPVPVIDISDEEEDESPQIRQDVETVIDMTGEGEDPAQLIAEFPIVLPAPNLRNPQNRLHCIQHHDLDIRTGDCVEITAIPDSCGAEFLKVTGIVGLPGAGCVLHGLPLTRTRSLNGQLPRKRNEVCMIIDSTRDDPRTEKEQAIIRVPLGHVINKRDLVCTNANYPRFKYNPQAHIQDVEESGRLVCRWKHKRIWATAHARQQGRPPAEFALLHMGPEDVATGSSYRRSEMRRFNTWRAGKLPANRDRWDIQPRGRHNNCYSFGDFFAGAGGASCGARAAHLDVQVAYVLDGYSRFRHGAQKLSRTRSRRDSPVSPCQPYSPAHTRAGKHDDSNEALLFVCQDVVKVERPRVITLEETFGILSHEKHAGFFKALVRGFTDLSFSLRWKIVDLRNWGVPMKRQRLVMIGSCPGEPLPDFPKNTHSERSATSPWNTVATALASIPNNIRDGMHNIDQVEHFHPPRSAWNPNVALPRTIVTKGADDFHPSGKREFTLRELATLCGFPVGHRFFGGVTGIKRQIGNCFPACAAEVLFTHVRKFMEQSDRHRRVDARFQMDQQAIVIDDREDDVIVLSNDDDDYDAQEVIIIDDDDGDQDAIMVDEADDDSDHTVVGDDDGDQDVVFLGVLSCRLV